MTVDIGLSTGRSGASDEPRHRNSPALGRRHTAAAVAAIFNIITRYANALDFAVPTEAEFDKAAGMMLKRGYS